MDAHREMKALLHEARIFLSKREAATTPTALHEASAGAKRCLVKAEGLLKVLDESLGKEGGLLEGELRRRRDLVGQGRKEKEGLEMLGNTMGVKRATAREAGAGTDGNKLALFNGRVGGGRVLGGKAQETERTRELDNEGVLGLQKQMLQEQDEGLETLLGIVRRQKTVGLAIGEELEVQNGMLEHLGEDVERVERKTRIASKRADRLS